MKKIDYISLSRHFSGEATDAENLLIFSWRDSDLINFSTYERLRKICLLQGEISIESPSKDNLIYWKNILDRIMVED